MQYNEFLIKVYRYLENNPHGVFDKVAHHPRDKIGYIHAMLWWAPGCFDAERYFFGCDSGRGMKIMNDLYQKVDFLPLPEIGGKVVTELHHPFMTVQIAIADDSCKYGKRHVYFTFFVVDDGDVRGLYCENYYQKFSKILMESREMDFVENEKLQIYCSHLQKLLKVLWKKIEEDERALQESALPVIEGISEEAAFDEFFALLNFDNQLTADDLQLLKEDWRLIREDRDALMQGFLARGIIEDSEVEFFKGVEADALLQLSFISRFNHYLDDWKFDQSLLCDFISDRIGFPFKGRRSHEIESVRKQLEKETDFSFVDFTNGEDSIHLFVVRKSDRKRLRALGNFLGLILE